MSQKVQTCKFCYNLNCEKLIIGFYATECQYFFPCNEKTNVENDIFYCKNCQRTIYDSLDMHSGDVTCENCGFVLYERQFIDQ